MSLGVRGDWEYLCLLGGDIYRFWLLGRGVGRTFVWTVLI